MFIFSCSVRFLYALLVPSSAWRGITGDRAKALLPLDWSTVTRCSTYRVFTWSSSTVLNDNTLKPQSDDGLQCEGPRMSVLRQKENKSHFQATHPLLFPGSISLPLPCWLGLCYGTSALSLSLCVNEKEDGAAYGAQSKEDKSTVSWTVTK